MTARTRFRAALERRATDRLPVTTHHLMSSFLNHVMGGMDNNAFFERFGIDPILWVAEHAPDTAKGSYFDPSHIQGTLEPRRIVSDQWRISSATIPDPQYTTVRYTIHTPGKALTTVLQSNEHTTWVSERLIKESGDIDIIASYAPAPQCDVAAVNAISASTGERAMIRGTIVCFDLYGQPGCWQDASVLFGIEDLILATYDDPEWVHAFLKILLARKMSFVDSLRGAEFDLLELGGGDASSTVISPKVFDSFVAPYDKQLIDRAHAVGQKIVYHTCGGMMPFLERLADMGPDAMETFTPAGMGGDTLLGEAKRRIGDRVCMIGGFDQFHFFTKCTPAETRAEVRRCFNEAGARGGYILCPSDHFFDADIPLLEAFADEARRCVY
jgi:uroporphyrinogen decarboxylase